jgi:hypothetical protein
MTIKPHQGLNTDIVKRLGRTLIDVADRYPLQFLTERDFFPLVYTFLTQHFPKVDTEKTVDSGRLDFRTGGTNPAALELALAPREFQDANYDSLRFRGHDLKNQLHASQNKRELEKLHQAANMVNRYLLLVDLRREHDFDRLKAGYEKHCPLDGTGCAIQVVYCCRTTAARAFQVGGKRRGAKGKGL